MSIPVMRGDLRIVTARAPPVAVLNQARARHLWPAQVPGGKRVLLRGRTAEVVGIVRDIKGRNLFEAPGPMLYLPLSQSYSAATVLHLRTALPPESFVDLVRREVNALDGDLPVYGIKPMEAHRTATLTPQRLLAYLIGAFGVMALVLASVGLYGLLAYSVAERTAEIGLRMALGAGAGDVVRLFVSRGLARCRAS